MIQGVTWDRLEEDWIRVLELRGEVEWEPEMLAASVLAQILLLSVIL